MQSLRSPPSLRCRLVSPRGTDIVDPNGSLGCSFASRRKEPPGKQKGPEYVLRPFKDASRKAPVRFLPPLLLTSLWLELWPYQHHSGSLSSCCWSDLLPYLLIIPTLGTHLRPINPESATQRRLTRSVQILFQLQNPTFLLSSDPNWKEKLLIQISCPNNCISPSLTTGDTGSAAVTTGKPSIGAPPTFP